MTSFSLEGWLLLLRWIHVLSGITWIGMLYYFNFVQTPFFASELGGQAKSAMTRGLVPNALWWFRWGAMFTFLSGLLYLLTRWGHENVPLTSDYMTRILTGALLGTTMWANVWFVIWPAQQVVIANATKVAAGGEADPAAPARGTRVAHQHAVLDSDGLLHGVGVPLQLARDREESGALLAHRVRFRRCARSERDGGNGPGAPEAALDGVGDDPPGARAHVHPVRGIGAALARRAGACGCGRSRSRRVISGRRLPHYATCSASGGRSTTRASPCSGSRTRFSQSARPSSRWCRPCATTPLRSDGSTSAAATPATW